MSSCARSGPESVTVIDRTTVSGLATAVICCSEISWRLVEVQPVHDSPRDLLAGEKVGVGRDAGLREQPA